MQLKRFAVEKLFGQYNHEINFPVRPEASNEPSLVLLCGPNGIGKTTILQMISGFKRLKFDIFRKVPFKVASLTFSDGTTISVTVANKRSEKKALRYLSVKYEKMKIELNIKHTGAIRESEQSKVDVFIEHFERQTSDVTVELVTTSRLQELYEEHSVIEKEVERQTILSEMSSDTSYDKHIEQKKETRRRRNVLLSERITRFIKDAQLNYRQFFSSNQPDLFPKILEQLAQKSQPVYNVDHLSQRLVKINQIDKMGEVYGLQGEKWNFQKLHQILDKRGSNGSPNHHALTVLNTYVEFLKSRSSERALLLDRLKTFKETASEFLQGKSVEIHADYGLKITTADGAELSEASLSSGEYHLLYLLVTTLTTQRRGTVIAIDEPELSMHLEWQRKLIRGILRCASMAQPQLIIATHSPDVTAEYPKACVHLGENKR